MTGVAVTGATGFIGRAVCRELVSRGVPVHAFGHRTAPDLPGANCDVIRNYEQIVSSTDWICIHLAGSPEASVSEKQPRAAIADATALARRVLRPQPEHAVFASSSLVYGDQVDHARREDEPAREPPPHGKTKLAGEKVFLDAAYAVARIANVYGEGSPRGSVITDITAQLRDNSPLELRAAQPVRDFIHVTDVARGLVELAFAKQSGIFNLGTGVGTSIGDLAHLALTLSGTPERKIRCTAPSGRLSSLVLDPAKAREALGWWAEIPLDRGLRRILGRDS